MTSRDILDRLRTVRDAGGDRVDPIWIELAILEIERLRSAITAWADADVRYYASVLIGRPDDSEQREASIALRRTVGR